MFLGYLVPSNFSGLRALSISASPFYLFLFSSNKNWHRSSIKSSICSVHLDYFVLNHIIGIKKSAKTRRDVIFLFSLTFGTRILDISRGASDCTNLHLQLYYLYCDRFAFSSGFISLCVLIFLTASSKCRIETRASEA